MLDDQLELIYNSSVWIYRKQWMIETNGERELVKSVLAAEQDKMMEVK